LLTPASPPAQPRPALVLVEPNTLTAWSLSTYLRQWFEVKCTSTVPTARRMLERSPAAALIVSDELPRRSVEALTRAARLTNPDVRIVVLVTAEHEPRVNVPGAAHLEKPFSLSALAELLGRSVQNAPPQAVGDSGGTA